MPEKLTAERWREELKRFNAEKAVFLERLRAEHQRQIVEFTEYCNQEFDRRFYCEEQTCKPPA